MRRGTRVASAYVAVTADGDGINESIVDAVDDAGDDIEGKGDEHGERYGDEFSEGFLSRMREKVSGRLGNVIGSRDAAGRAGDEAGESFVDRMVDKTRNLGDKIGSELSDRLASNPEQVRRGIDRAFDEDFADRIGDRLGSRIASSMTESIDRQSASIGSAIADALDGAVSRNRKGGDKDGGIGSMIGRMFGAGSRNNFLNLLGKTIGGVVGLVEKGAGFAATFAEGMAKAGEGASMVARFSAGFAGIGTKLGAGFASLGAVLPVLVIGLGAVLLTMSAMVSVAGALLGILTAMTSTIASGLVGALAVAAPMMAALAVAGGLVALAFTSMTEEQRKYLKDAFEPFHQAVTGIGQIIFTQFTKPLYDGQSAIQVWSTNLQKALVPLAGVAQSTAKAFADAGNTITASLSGPGFVRFFDSLRLELPTIIRNLSSALGGFLNGVSGMFAAIMPYVTQFSRYLDDVATRFSKWANSAKGQNSISDFVGRAVDSLKSLWGFLKEVGGLFSDIFFDRRSQQAGNNIFDSMTREVQNFREKLKGVDLEKWFDDAIKFGGKLWRAIKDIAKVIQRLYDDGTLAAVGSLFESMAGFIKLVSDELSPVINMMKGEFPDALNNTEGPLGDVKDVVEALANALEALQDAFDAFTGFGPNGPPSLPDAPQQQPWEEANPGYPQARYQTASRGGRRNGLKNGPSLLEFMNTRGKGPSLEDLQTAGQAALAATLEEHGGHMVVPDKDKDKDKSKKDKDKEKKDSDKHHGEQLVAEWANPYIAFAEAILKRAPTLAEELREAGREAREVIADAFKDMQAEFGTLTLDLGDSLVKGVMDATKSFSADEVIESFNGMIESVGDQIMSAVSGNADNAWSMKVAAYDAADAMIRSAEEARYRAAEDLKNARTPKEANAAREALKTADNALGVARAQARKTRDAADRTYDDMIAAGQASADRIGRARAIVAGQAIMTPAIVGQLVSGEKNINATLADFAEARGQVAEQLAAANTKLADAIALRDNYATAVGDSMRAFGSLLTAQAQTLNGVQQALTADDITDNLRTRLDKIKDFREDMRQLLAAGLSDSAYKQIVDAGVEEGGAYADALLAGGQGAISEVNSLTDQIDETSTFLGNEAANQLYQAGVAAAQGLVNGLTSLSNELTTAAAELGRAIAQAIKNELGIASPSRVLFDMMHDDVGDGMVNGLNAAQGKVGVAASLLAAQVAVSPEVAAYAASKGSSGIISDEDAALHNGSAKFMWTGDLVTPTEDPHAVAAEVLNELTGRLP